jgi:hypothetical protein
MTRDSKSFQQGGCCSSSAKAEVGSILFWSPTGNSSVEMHKSFKMLNISFKIFTKFLANRFTSVANRVIRPTQTAFLPGRYIMEGIVILHKSLHEIKRKHQSWILLKLGFEKTYDKVNWKFLQQTLRMKGFSAQWCKWIDCIVRGGSVGVKINDDIGSFFHRKRIKTRGSPVTSIVQHSS